MLPSYVYFGVVDFSLFMLDYIECSGLLDVLDYMKFLYFILYI
jgi:hypothetical protein